MATLINNQSGNMSSAATWSVADTASLLDSEAASTASTTSWVASPSFTPGAITIDALAVKIAGHTAVGNVSVRLGKAGSITSITATNPAVITSASHGLTTGEAVLLSGTNSTPALTGPYTVTVLSANTFSVPVAVTVAGSAGSWATVLATITSNTLVAAPVFSTGVAHGLIVGTQITIKGSTSTPSYNGTFTIATTPSTTTFTLTGAASAVGGVSGQAVYNIVGVPDTTVTIAANDIPSINAATINGWTQFKLPSSVTLNAGTLYTLQVTGTTAGNATFYRNGTSDWSRILRTTTTQAPASGDSLFIAGDYTGIGTGNSYSVTMDGTSTTNTFAALQVSAKATFAYGTSASTAYYFKINNSPTIYSGGTLTIGTSSAPMPSTSTGKFEVVCTVNVQFGFDVRLGSTFMTGGNVITNSALLAADAAAAATTLTTNVSTGWKSGDLIGIAATTRTRTECESKALTADASGTGLTIAALTNAHGGSAGVAAELINLTRNVSIFSASATLQTYILVSTSAIVDFEATEFYNMGSATVNKRGIDVTTITGSCTINNCSLHDFNVVSSIGINVATTANNLTISNTVFYNCSSASLIIGAGTAGTNTNYSNLIAILTGGTVITISQLFGNFSNITAVGGLTRGILLTHASTGPAFGTISNLTAHSNTGAGIEISTVINFGNNPYGLITGMTSWRNTTYGIVLNNVNDTIFDTINLFGNATANLQYLTSCGNTWVKSLTSNSGTTLTCPVGIQVPQDTKETYIDNSTFGVTTAHATGDVQISAANIYPKIVFRNCIMNSATPVVTPGNMVEGGQISSARHQQTSGNHKVWKKFGTITPDTVIAGQNTPSVRLTPNAANQKLQGSYKRIAVPSGQTCVITVYVRKSVAGDGSAYNGNQPRLIQKADAATGNNSDAVLATADNTFNGAFQKLTATIAPVTDDCVVQVYVDCDGTAGWVNYDDWSVNS